MFGFEHFAKEMWVRLFAGEASPFEVRCCSGMLALMPLMLAAFTWVGPYCFSSTESIGFMLFLTGVMFVGCLLLRAWVAFIPTKVSWVLAAVSWLAALGWAITAFI
jgi:hypothetical protein